MNDLDEFNSAETLSEIIKIYRSEEECINEIGSDEIILMQDMIKSLRETLQEKNEKVHRLRRILSSHGITLSEEMLILVITRDDDTQYN